MDSLPALDVSSYVTLDVRLAWRPQENLELSLVGQNLLDRHQKELESQLFTLGSEVERGVYGKITWGF